MLDGTITAFRPHRHRTISPAQPHHPQRSLPRQCRICLQLAIGSHARHPYCLEQRNGSRGTGQQHPCRTAAMAKPPVYQCDRTGVVANGSPPLPTKSVAKPVVLCGKIPLLVYRCRRHLGIDAAQSWRGDLFGQTQASPVTPDVPQPRPNRTHDVPHRPHAHLGRNDVGHRP